MQTWEQSYAVAGGGTVEIEQLDGSVRIVGWEQPVVRVRASWPGAGRIEDRLDVAVTANRVSLVVKPYRTGFLGLTQDSLLDLELSVPFGTRCQVEAGSGPVTVEETRGQVAVESGSGRVMVTGVAGAVVETGSGSVQARLIDGPVSIETGSGSVEVELVHIRPDGEYRIETGSGRVTVAVPPDAGLRLELETRGRVDFGGLPARVLRQEDQSITACLNGGGPVLSVETGSGSISLRPCGGEAPSVDREVAATRLAELVKEDPALEQSEHLARILQMVQEGRLSVAEAEELLQALDGEEA